MKEDAVKDATRLTDIHWVVLQEIHANLALLLTASFTRKFDEVVEVDINDVQKTAYADFITRLSNPSFSYQFLLKPTHGGVILNFSNSL
ncbi:MAG TPA: hypothetical protein EYQ18_10720 [Candidatus Handelsmanbacteria bacterium]|nr:hypothetical protein [Candidatus Handelsmanbacteria bacterium]